MARGPKIPDLNRNQRPRPLLTCRGLVGTEGSIIRGLNGSFPK